MIDMIWYDSLIPHLDIRVAPPGSWQNGVGKFLTQHDFVQNLSLIKLKFSQIYKKFFQNILICLV